jgi:hypothetical protein
MSGDLMLEIEELKRERDDLIATRETLIRALLPIARAYPDDPGTSDLHPDQPVTIDLRDVRRVWYALGQVGVKGKAWGQKR